MTRKKTPQQPSQGLEDLIQVRIVRLVEIIAQFAQQSTQAHGLSNTDMRILNVIDHSNGVSVNEIARQAHIDKAWVSRSLRALENKNMVARKSADNDSRRQIITLTKKSKGLIEGVRPLVIAREKKLLQGIDSKVFKQELDILMSNAEVLLNETQAK